jgi:glutamate-ammonia-ligase adenylyltransferase
VSGSPDADELVGASADPAAARLALARHDVEALAATGALPAAVALFGASRWAVDALAIDPGAAGVLATLHDPVDVGAAVDDDDLVVRHRRELLRVAARDLLDLDDLGGTVTALADGAVGAIRASLRLAGADGPVAVVAMGKLGGRELNFASDVDLLLVAERPAEAEPALRRAMALLRRCARVDLGLRPEGRDGALVRTVEGYASHWERWSAAWERQALLKAAVVAGDADLGAAWQAAADRAVWERPFTADDIRSIRALKERAEAELARRPGGERDVKRGLGGIRDVEFAVQLLCLVHGGTDPTLRVRGTVPALAELAAGGYVAVDDVAALAEAYGTLRRVEHRLQLVDLSPAHVLPDDGPGLDRLARSLGERATPERSAGAALVEALRAHRATARRVHERLWFRPLLGAFAGRDRALAAFGFADADRTAEGIAELSRGLTRSSRMMQQLLPLVLDWLSRSPAPDLGLLGLRRLADGPARAGALVEAFRESPEVARRLCVVLGTSSLLADHLAHNPDLVAPLGDDGSLVPRSPEELSAAVHEAVSWRPTAPERRTALKRLTDREGLRIGAADVLGHLSTREVGAALTDLATAALAAAVGAVDGGPELSVVALGRFGGGELSYPSDLDLVFVCPPGAQERAERAALHVLRFLGQGPTHLYDVDTDLRPEGRDGPLVRTLDAWAAYVDRWAQPWERLAWVKARPVAGDLSLAAELVEGVLAPWVWDRPVTDVERTALRRVKVRVEEERIRPGDDRDFHLKLGRGGLVDVEFCVQLLQLDHGIRTTSTVEAMGLLRRSGVLDADEHAALADAHGFLEAVRNRLFLVTGEPGDALPARPERLEHLASSLGTDPAGLRERHRKVTRRARRVVERRFFDS